jgi:hypothetical protein
VCGILIHHQGIISPPSSIAPPPAPRLRGRKLRGGRLAAYCPIRLGRRSSTPPLLAGFRRAQLAGNTLLVIRNYQNPLISVMTPELDAGLGEGRGRVILGIEMRASIHVPLQILTCSSFITRPREWGRLRGMGSFSNGC